MIVGLVSLDEELEVGVVVVMLRVLLVFGTTIEEEGQIVVHSRISL